MRKTKSVGKIKRGEAFGLEGDLFLLVLGALVLSIVLVIICLPPLSVLPALCVAGTPLFGVGLFLSLFYIGKPPGYFWDKMMSYMSDNQLKKSKHVRKIKDKFLG